MQTRKISTTTFPILSVVFSTGLLATPSAWANIFVSTSTLNSHQGRLSSHAYTAGEDDALLHRGAGHNYKIWPRRDEQNFASNIPPSKTIVPILCRSNESLKSNSSINVRIHSYCSNDRDIFTPVHGAQDPSLPYLLAPRLGKVSSPTPTVRWNAVAGVRRYKIRLVGQRDRKVLWTSDVEASHITLPAHLNLVPGELYRVVVEADNGTSSRMEPCSAGLGFSVLPSDAAKELENKRAKIRSQRGSGAPPKLLALREADELLLKELKMEAFDLLKLHEQKNTSLQGQFLLGTVANSLGLNQLAQAYFSQAVMLATQNGDAEGIREASKSEKQAPTLAKQARRGNCDPFRSVDTPPSAP